ncbi:oogenesis-related [Synchiropus splendidus]|uniref:oogenesis-related n=1 Tax=Synchiropus splendidus TaxID=270530 RepID=UPI00237D9963|nr:oogenesis-related [Synchiropus splendidus]
MTCEPQSEVAEQVVDSTEDRVVPRDGVIRSVLRGIFWPFGIVVKTYRGFCWLLGFRQPKEAVAVPSPGRQTCAGRKRLHRVTRLLLTILPRWLQGALGYPVSSDIGRCLSPEVRVSPIKPCGKGSKRKQDELDEDEADEEEHPSWVEALTQELVEEGPEEDPDYEPSSVETESSEFRSQNDTESDIEVQASGVVVIEDVSVEVPAV